MSQSVANVDKLPEWVPDEKAPDCMLCGKTFSWKRGKHHCRLCGYVVCGKCSENKVKLPKLATSGPVRVCDSCFQKNAPAYMQRKPAPATAKIAAPPDYSADAATEPQLVQPSSNAPAAAAKPKSGANGYGATASSSAAASGAAAPKTEASSLLSPTGSKTARAVVPGYDSDDDEGQCAACKNSCVIA